MSYGSTYTKKPETVSKTKLQEAPKLESVVGTLCFESGYNRENLEKIELESKLDIDAKKLFFFSRKPSIVFGEKLKFPAPYSIDNILGITEAIHECYGFVSDKTTEAFTKVTKEGKTKIKIKSNTKYITENRIIILMRDEEQKENLSAKDIARFIVNEARSSNLTLKYIGSFNKTSKEAFIFNPISGRIFVMATNICSTTLRKTALYQLEVEYYGRINGYKNSTSAIDELSILTQLAITDASRLGYICRTSKKTKFDWLVENAR
jgi:hypothetical protein